MIEVTYLNTAKQEKHTSFEDYNEFVRASKLAGLPYQIQRQSQR